ncbi:MAG TPA: secretin N-terminal domain-containing protein [Verrucomicrobiae bacterium]|nr:secretin N-terminal domain-containing protein [Verrucomicrobiae bacterium]
MKIISTIMLLTVATGSFAADETVVTTNAPATDVAPVVEATSATATDVAAGTNGGLRLNFRGVALEQVLNYLSDAAGFIIVLDAQPRGKVDVWSNTPLSKDEAVDLLNSVLNKNGLASIRNGRTLTIVNKDEAKTRNIPVRQGSNPDGIPSNDEIVTQIIPVRFVEVTQLIKDLQPLVSTSTTMTANEAGNAIVMTDTQANIRRVAEIIQAIDQGAEDVTEVEVFQLQNADPTEMATQLTSVFPDETRGSSQSPVQFGRGGGNPFRNFFGRDGGGNSGGGGDQSARIKKRARVIAVADARTQSVIVSAASGLMEQIRNMIAKLDASSAKKQFVRVYSLENADAEQVEQVLQEMFETTNTRNNNRNSQNRNNALQNRATQQQQNNNTGIIGNRTGNRGGNPGLGGF